MTKMLGGQNEWVSSFLMAHRHIEGHFSAILGGQKFIFDVEVLSDIHQWLEQRSASFFVSGIQKLVDRCNKCFKEFQQYVEEWTSFDV